MKIWKKSRRTKEDWVFDIINYLLLILIALITLYPFYYILILSLNEGNDAVLGGIFLLPRMFTLENYKEFFSDSSWLNALWVTFLRTVGGTAIGVFFTCMVATVYKGNIIKNLIMDCQSYTKYRPNETTGGIFVSWRRKEELPTGGLTEKLSLFFHAKKQEVNAYGR